MGKDCTILEMLELLARIETGIADYYRACAAQWAQDREFWLFLAKQEDGHCAMFKRMSELVGAAPERYKLRAPFNPKLSESFLGWLASSADEVKNGTIERRMSFKVAMNIEKTILEGNIHELVLTDDMDFKKIVDTIVEQSNLHEASIKACAADL